MMEQQIRKDMVAFGASLFTRGLSAGSGGNMSVKLPDGNILATPTNISLGRLVPERLSLLGATGTLLSGDSPSKECTFHLEVYKARPDCGAVVHLHSPYAVALSCCQGLPEHDVMRPFTPYYVMKVAPLPLLPYCRPGSPELVRAIAAKAAEAHCLLLANHGPVVAGKNLEDAVNIAEELEETARLFFILQQYPAGIRYLTDEQKDELLPSMRR